MLLRLFRPDDLIEILQLFRDTVHQVCAHDYNEAQRNAWAPEKLDEKRWLETLSSNYTVVTEQDGLITGFGDMEPSGYFNRLFVHKDYQGCGIAGLIAAALEQYVADKQIGFITVDASITAKPFFEKRGYKVIKEQQVERNGQIFTNFRMEKLPGL